jgi:hypothetical protein
MQWRIHSTVYSDGCVSYYTPAHESCGHNNIRKERRGVYFVNGMWVHRSD